MIHTRRGLSATTPSQTKAKESKVDKELRRARNRYDSLIKSQQLNEAVLAVPGAVNSDVQCIADQLFERLRDYRYPSGIRYVRQFNDEAIAWVTRQTQLRVMLREVLPQRIFGPEIIAMLYSRVPDYNGDAFDKDAFQVWVFHSIRARETDLKALAGLMGVHAPAVRRGIQKVLSSCCDLDGCITDIEDELFSVVWLDVAHNVSQYLDFSEQTSISLFWKGYWTARAWKTQRLDEINKGTFLKPAPVDDLEDAEQKMYFYATSGKLPPKPINLWRLGDEKKDDDDVVEEPAVEPSLMGLSLEDLWNPIIIMELPWTEADVQRELRSAGPFRANEPAPDVQLRQAA